MEKPTLIGEMVVLRPVRAGDADALWESVTDPEGRRLAGSTRTFTRREVERWAATVADAEDRVDLAITAHGSDEYLGEIVLSDIDEVAGSARLRLAMRPAYRGRGYGTEATELVLGLAFDGLALHRVGLEVLAINPRVQSLYANLGFVVEGRLREAARDGDRWCDAVVMGLLEDEYRAGRQAPQLG
ncbi:GNAT family N-acetyltransferase [Cellulomonas marina]|uniref:Protein N-acetyltransferase, RimJ/RimL family n=1 Tax=Cellulomonas marina TaxID=988821 RepID=A0A1I0YP88_9CELL|nr:GNAT family protein [Cellulomonas marina]GIG30817.1 aminoglycoside N(6')-acetyltransferase [Cellulomonas marina]SFB14118.1 Protein N-acetyltransferase, RimJ/RimL family [Cellulomonas marina]